METLKLYLKDYDYIETWDEFERYLAFNYLNKEKLINLLSYDKITLYQNTCDGITYNLRDKSIKDSILYLFNEIIDGIIIYKADEDDLDFLQKCYKHGLKIEYRHLQDWVEGHNRIIKSHIKDNK